jgi:hypothetical protein
VETPTPDELRASSALLNAKLPGDGGGPNDKALEVLAAQAAILVAMLTFRLIEPVDEAEPIEGYVFVDVPVGLRPIAVRAIALMINREVVTGDPAFAEQVATGRRLRGFSAGPYSESYFAPGEFARKGASQGRPPMDADDSLDAALWALATQDARDYFISEATGVTPPAAVISSFDYRKTAVGDRPGGLGNFRGSAPGPDGW